MKLSILDKLKLLMWLNSLSKGVTKMDKLKGLLSKLDGLKTVLGLGVVVAYYVVPQFGGPHMPEVVLKIGSALAGVGMAAKLEKGVGILSKAIEMTKKGLDIAQKVVDALAPKPEAK